MTIQDGVEGGLSVANKPGLSMTARAVGAAWFGMMRVADDDSYLRFGMVESRPTKKAQAGLDELVAKGWIKRTDERCGAVRYSPLRSFEIIAKPFLKAAFTGKFPKGSVFKLVEPIKRGGEVGNASLTLRTGHNPPR